MEPFSYESSMGTITVTHTQVYNWMAYRVLVNGKFFIDLKKKPNIGWQVQNPMPTNFFTDDILAIGDEIDKRLQQAGEE